jgi:hypothetical protein
MKNTEKQNAKLAAKLAAILAELVANPDRSAIIEDAASKAMGACNGFEERFDLPGIVTDLAIRLAEWQAADVEELCQHFEDERKHGDEADKAHATECRNYYAAHWQAAGNAADSLRKVTAAYRDGVNAAESL